MPGIRGVVQISERLARGPAVDQGVCPTFAFSEVEQFAL